MSALYASALLLRNAVRTQMVPRANLTAEPAKHKVTAVEQAFVLAVMAATILVPSGWILANLENYKKKE